MHNLSFENEFDLHENEPVGGTHFHMNDFSRRLVLTRSKKQRLNALFSVRISRTFVLHSRQN